MAGMQDDDRMLKEALATILHRGLVAMRGADGKDARYVQVESEHIHNLPWCLARMRPGDVRHYHKVERPRYVAAMEGLGGRRKDAANACRDEWAVVGGWLKGRQ